MRLTDLSIKSLPIPEQGQKTYFEREGFGVRVSQGGSRTFVVMYGKKRQLKSLGRYPDISLKTARREAKKVQAAQSTQTGIVTLQTAISRFIEDSERRNRPATTTNYRRFLSRLTKTHLDKVTIDDIGQSPHAVMSGKVFFNWCIRQGYTDKNPFAPLRVSYGKRDRVLSPSELKAVWQYDRPPFTDYIKLLILTGQRRGQFEHFEIRDDTLFFPASQMKGKEDHTIPLLPLARKYAERLERFNSWGKSKSRLDKHVQIPHWTPHDLRRTFATIHAQIGTPIHVTEKILDHRTGTISGVAAIYNRHTYLEESREALAKYEDHLQTLVA